MHLWGKMPACEIIHHKWIIRKLEFSFYSLAIHDIAETVRLTPTYSTVMVYLFFIATWHATGKAQFILLSIVRLDKNRIIYGWVVSCYYVNVSLLSPNPLSVPFNYMESRHSLSNTS